MPPSVVAPPPAERDGLPPGHHHTHRHHHPPGAPQLTAVIDQAIRRQAQQAQDVFANQPGPVLRPPSPTRGPRPGSPSRPADVGYVGQQRRPPTLTRPRPPRPASTEPMDVDMQPVSTDQQPRPTHLRAPAPSPNRMTVPTQAEPRRTSWSWGTLTHLGSPSETTNANLYAAPTVGTSTIGPSTRAPVSRPSPSNSPQDPPASLPLSSHQEPLPPTRSSILAPTGALARAFNFAVPRLNTGGQDRGGPTSAGPSSGGSGSGGEERTRRGFFRGLSGGSGDRDRDESRSSSRGAGGDMDI